MIEAATAEAAVDWLRDNAKRMGEARATRVYLEQWIKTVRADLTQKAVGSSVAERDTAALAHPEYLAALQGYREAVKEDETLRWLATAAEAKLECWRTQEASLRASMK